MAKLNTRFKLIGFKLLYLLFFSGFLCTFINLSLMPIYVENKNYRDNMKFPLIAAEEWYLTLGNTSEDWGYDIEVDKITGDIYIVGYETDINLGHKKIILSRFNNSGNKIWQREWYEGFDDNYGTAIALGPNGSVYVGGQIFYGSNQLKMVLIKYDSDGEQLWNQTFGNCLPYAPFGVGLDVDSLGNVYICSNNDLDPGSMVYDYEMDLFKFNSTGGFEWERTWKAGVGYFDIAYGIAIAIDSLDMIYVTGYRCCSVQYGMSEIFLLKYNSNGDFQFDKLWESSGNDMGTCIEVGPDDYVYIGGITDADANGANGDICLLKYHNSGALLWARTYGGSYTDFADGLAFDSFGYIYVVGSKFFGNGDDDGEICWLKYDSLGNREYCSVWGGNYDEQGYGIDFDGEDNMFIIGITKSYGGGNYDIVLIKNPDQRSCAEPGVNPFNWLSDIPFWLQAIVGGVVSAIAGIVIKVTYSKTKVKRKAIIYNRIEKNIDKIDNLKEHLMIHLGLKWEKFKDTHKEYNEGHIGKGEFIKRGMEIIGKKFIKAFSF